MLGFINNKWHLEPKPATNNQKPTGNLGNKKHPVCKKVLDFSMFYAAFYAAFCLNLFSEFLYRQGY